MFELMPALPFSVALVLGIAAGFYLGVVPLALCFILLFSALAVGFCLHGNRRWRTVRAVPLIVATFFLGMAIVQIEKERTGIGTFGSRTEIVKRQGDSQIRLKANVLRAKILQSLKDEDLEERQFAIVAAMALGDRRMLDYQTRDEYAVTGVGHLLALSGMHLSILFVLLSLLFVHRQMRILGKALVLVAVWAYVLVVGMPASVVRAATMLTIYTLCTADRQSGMSGNALCVTAFIMLFCNPLQLWDVGFQMSFMALAAILMFASPIINILASKWLFNHPLLRRIWTMIAVSCAAQLGTAPLIVYYFGRFSCYFLLANLVAIPLVTVLLYSVFFALFFSFLPWVKAMFISIVNGTTFLLNAFVSEVASWRGVSIENLHMNWLQLMIVYAMILTLGILMRQFPRRTSR